MRHHEVGDDDEEGECDDDEGSPISLHSTWFEAEHVENVNNDEMGNDVDDDDDDDDDDDKKELNFRADQ